MTAPPILIFAIGNESRGDDAMAPLLLRRLAAWLEEQRTGKFELLEEYQLQIEHVADMTGRELVLFIDAGIETPDPYIFYRSKPSDSRPMFSHELTPDYVLATYTQVYQKESPPAFVLCIRGERFELGELLTCEAEQRMERAMVFLRALLKEPELSAWMNYEGVVYPENVFL
jgi:hydrogenase maturation protease